MDVHRDAVVKKKRLERQAQHQRGGANALRRKLKISKALGIVVRVDDPLGVQFQGVAGHVLHGHLRIRDAQHLGQLRLRDVIGQRPLGEECPYQRVAGNDGIPQGPVKLPGIEQSLVCINIDIGEKVVAAGLGGGGIAGVKIKLQLAGGVEAGHPALGGPGLVQNGVKGRVGGAALGGDSVSELEIRTLLQGFQLAACKAVKDKSRHDADCRKAEQESDNGTGTLFAGRCHRKRLLLLRIRSRT